MARIESKSGQSKPGFRERALRWSEKASKIAIPAGLGFARSGDVFIAANPPRTQLALAA